MYKILFLNFNPRSKKYIHLGFKRIGVQVLEYINEYVDRDYSLFDSKINSLINTFKPDIVFSYGWWMNLENIDFFSDTLKKRGIFHIYWATDDPPCFDIMSLPIAKKSDLVFTTCIECIEKYKAYGLNAHFMLFGCSPPHHRKVAQSKEFMHDISLLGHNYNVTWNPGYFSYRLNGINNIIRPLIDGNYDIMIWGLWWNSPDRIYNIPESNYGSVLPYEKGPQVYSSSKIVLGLQTVGDSISTFSSRTLEVLGCGTFHLSQYSPALEQYFKKGVHMEWSSSPQETIELVDFYLKNDSSREKIALQGQREVYSKHTWYHRAQSVLEIINKNIK